MKHCNFFYIMCFTMVTNSLLLNWSLIRATHLSPGPTTFLPISFVDNIKNPCGLFERDHFLTTNVSLNSHLVAKDVGMELLRASQLAFNFVHELEMSSMGLYECTGLSLNSFTPIPDFKRMPLSVSLVSMRKVLVNYLVHVYFVSIEQKQLSLKCNIQVRAKEFRRLLGKLQYLLCNLMQAMPSSQTNFMQVLYEARKNHIWYFSCSASEIRKCLILQRIHELLNTITISLEGQLMIHNNP